MASEDMVSLGCHEANFLRLIDLRLFITHSQELESKNVEPR